MCGIAGVARTSCDKAPAGLLTGFANILEHRGPDDRGVFEASVHGIGLVQTRLSIQDLSPLGHQPMLSHDGEVALVFNGEIYNFRELRAELESDGHAFLGDSDTEVLLRLYLFYRALGDVTSEALGRMLRRINGIFAFAIWDTRSEALLMARDALGVKPLYYTADESGLQFASEIKALAPVDRSVDVAALDRYMSFLWCPGNGTPFANVRKLGPGEGLWVKHGTIHERFVWYRLPVFRRAEAGIQAEVTMPRNDAIQETASRLRLAVHRQLVSDVPVGAFLSGGLDSSSVVAFAREKSPSIMCFTIEAADAGSDDNVDDLPYARRVAAHLNVPLEVVQVDSSRMADDLVAMVAQLDEPLADPAPLNVLYISRFARHHGIKVLLSGAGGDDLFTGYRRHVALNYERLWSWLPKPARRALEYSTKGLNQHHSTLRRLRKLFDGASLDADARLVNYFRWVRRRDLLPLYSAEFRAALGDSCAEDPMLQFLEALPSDIAPIERLLALEQRFFLTDHNLIYTDKMSMAVGVEVRVPFLDLELVEFAARIPATLKQRGREGKWVLKKAMEPYLPHDVIYRPKTGFGAPLRRWMRKDLRPVIADVLGESSIRRRGLFDPAEVNRLVLANDEGRIDASYTLLSLICVELWCRRFVDQRGEHTNTQFQASC